MALLMEASSRSRARAGLKRHAVKVDMTPMVDLGFLLIAFFVMTTELNRPVTLKLVMPRQDGPETKIENSNALTFLLSNDDIVYYYHGQWKDALASGHIFKTTFKSRNSLGKIIHEKQLYLDKAKISPEGRNGLMLLIKPGNDASYKNVIDGLDEALIYNVQKYVVVNPVPEEMEYMLNKTPKPAKTR